MNGLFLKMFTEKNIKAGFWKTGIWPWDPSVITPVIMASSIPRSINAGFPLPQPSPVCAFVNFLDTTKSVKVETTNLMIRLTIGNGTVRLLVTNSERKRCSYNSLGEHLHFLSGCIIDQFIDNTVHTTHETNQSILHNNDDLSINPNAHLWTPPQSMLSSAIIGCFKSHSSTFNTSSSTSSCFVTVSASTFALANSYPSSWTST